jgi:hypothetical protein
MLRRTLWHQVRHTLTGKAAVLLLAVAAPSLWRVARGGSARAATYADLAALRGALVWAEVFTVVACAAFVASLYARQFTRFSSDEPLQVFGGAHRALAAHRDGVVTIGTSIIYQLLFFYLFHGRRFMAAYGSGWLLLPHAFLLSLQLFIAGVLAQALTRRLLEREGMQRRAELVFRWLGMVSLLLLILPAIGPSLLRDHAAEQLRWIGAHGERAGFFLQFPSAIVLLARRGDWLAAGLWACAFLGLVLAAVAVFARSLAYPIADPSSASIRSRFAKSLFARANGAAAPDLAWLFFRKDVVAVYLRQPSLYFLHHWMLLGLWGGGTAITIHYYRAQAIGHATATAIVVMIAATLGAIVAAHRCLPALGLEGAQLAALRPVISPRALWRAKLLANAPLIAAHAGIHSIAMWAVAAGFGLATPLALVLAAALWSAVICGPVALGIGFLLPDFTRARGLVHGATRTGRFIYMWLVSSGIGAIGLGAWMRGRGMISAAEVATLVAVLTTVLVACAGASTAMALARFNRLEE